MGCNIKLKKQKICECGKPKKPEHPFCLNCYKKVNTELKSVEAEVESNNTYTDDFGYMRYRDNGELVHRIIAYKFIYSKNPEKYPGKFSEYIIHHKDHDKRNNHHSNLAVISQKEHSKKHSDILWNKKKGAAYNSRFDTELTVLLGKKALLIMKWLLKIYLLVFTITFIIGVYKFFLESSIGEKMVVYAVLSGVIVVTIYLILKIAAKTFIFSRDQMEEFKSDFELRK